MNDLILLAALMQGPQHGYALKKLAGFMAGHGDMHNNRSEEHTSELQSHLNLVCRLLLEKKKNNQNDKKKHKKHVPRCTYTIMNRKACSRSCRGRCPLTSAPTRTSVLFVDIKIYTNMHKRAYRIQLC